MKQDIWKKSLLTGLLCLACLFGTRSPIAWWSVVYPQSLYEARILEEERDDEKDEEKSGGEKQIKWKLAEWIAGLFS